MNMAVLGLSPYQILPFSDTLRIYTFVYFTLPFLLTRLSFLIIVHGAGAISISRKTTYHKISQMVRTVFRAAKYQRHLVSTAVVVPVK